MIRVTSLGPLGRFGTAAADFPKSAKLPLDGCVENGRVADSVPEDE
jgi:hypothetical protein